MGGQLCGNINSQGVARPSLFPMVGYHFTHENNPHVSYQKVGIFGEHHIFIRCKLEYRHNAKRKMENEEKTKKSKRMKKK